MNYKNYNKIVLSTILLALFFVAIFNLLVNPFLIFKHKDSWYNRNHPDLRKQERLTKMVAMKRNNSFNTIFTGSSREDFSLPEDYYRKVSGNIACNMAMQGAGFEEQKYIIEQAMKANPNLKYVLMGIDFDFYYSPEKTNNHDLEVYNQSMFKNLITVLLSKDALSSSMMTVIKSVNPNYNRGFSKKIFKNDEINESFYKTIHQYRNTGIGFKDTPDLSELRKEIEFLNNNNIEVILYMHPVHSAMYEILKQNGCLDKIRSFKLELAKIQPFYDFYYPNMYTEETISPEMKYFFECSHCTYLLGEKILDTIFLNKEGFGYLATVDNINDKHQNFIKELSKWEHYNPEWVAKIKEIRSGK